MAETMEKAFPFDSVEVNGKPDRVYVADDFARYFRAFISSGTFMKDSTNLQVLANGDMTVTYKPGDMMIDGYRYHNPFDIIIQLDPADGVMDRIDRISATWIQEERDIHYTLQKGELSFSPKPPACRRTAEYKDYVVADVYVRAGAISINQKDITDQRLNSEVCGLAVAFSEIDTTTIFLQFTDWFNHVRQQGELNIDNLIDALTAQSTERYETFLADLRAFYRDIRSRGQQDYDDFNAEISAYIDDLEARGDSGLTALLQQLINFRNTNEADFLKWLQEMRNKLGEYPSGEFQLQLSQIQAQQEDMMEMLMTGMAYTKLLTDDGNYIVNDKGKPILASRSICKCKG